ncbi:MAG: ATP-dependent Clp protease adaptor ClpS [Gemmatales bacterium]|nr:ATP-dependent Clp protease adaptor ClpS [Gemmatales bacterium]MDW8388133.1 ATP-dependent Clp protease adaptor ClpS [Gemmatales bacterium]
MSDESRDQPVYEPDETRGKRRTSTRSQPRSRSLPPYKVLLHNDHINEFSYVVRTVIELTHMNRVEAQQRTLEAHCTGLSLLLVTHKERAELYVEQFASKGITVTIEPV